MHFNLSEEQRLLQSSVARFVDQQYSFDVRQKDVALPEGFDQATWNQFAELGWLSVPVSESGGGFGGNAIDVMVLMEEMGNGLVATPYIASIMLFAGLIDLALASQFRVSLLEQTMAGTLQGAFAHQERQSRYCLSDVQTVATASGNQYIINGEKALVLNGAVADQFVVSARTSGSQLDPDGISLFLVDGNATGMSRTTYRLMDGQLVANIKFDKVRVTDDRLLGQKGQGYALINQVVHQATIAVCAEGLGLMNRLKDTTLTYTRARKQFGVPIASFQVLQHRMVDMFMACEQMRSMLYRTVCSQGTPDAERCIHALKVMAGRNGRLVGNQAIQLHGGMGLTDELDVGHCVKRLMMINTFFGDADYHQQKFASWSLSE